MQYRISALIVAALLAFSSLALAADKEPGSQVPGADAAASVKPAQTTAAEKKAKAAAKKKAAAPRKLVDINSASKAELMKLPGISEADAQRIIEGRPSLTKARLVTNGTISKGAYDSIRKLIVAKQK